MGTLTDLVRIPWVYPWRCALGIHIEWCKNVFCEENTWSWVLQKCYKNPHSPQLHRIFNGRSMGMSKYQAMAILHVFANKSWGIYMSPSCLTMWKVHPLWGNVNVISEIKHSCWSQEFFAFIPVLTNLTYDSESKYCKPTKSTLSCYFIYLCRNSRNDYMSNLSLLINMQWNIHNEYQWSTFQGCYPLRVSKQIVCCHSLFMVSVHICVEGRKTIY